MSQVMMMMLAGSRAFANVLYVHIEKCLCSSGCDMLSASFVVPASWQGPSLAPQEFCRSLRACMIGVPVQQQSHIYMYTDYIYIYIPRCGPWSFLCAAWGALGVTLGGCSLLPAVANLGPLGGQPMWVFFWEAFWPWVGPLGDEGDVQSRCVWETTERCGDGVQDKGK